MLRKVLKYFLQPEQNKLKSTEKKITWKIKYVKPLDVTENHSVNLLHHHECNKKSEKSWKISHNLWWNWKSVLSCFKTLWKQLQVNKNWDWKSCYKEGPTLDVCFQNHMIRLAECCSFLWVSFTEEDENHLLFQDPFCKS